MTQAIFSNRAARDVDDIWRYAFKTWGLAQADGYIEDITETCDALARGARLGRSEPAFDGILKYPMGKHVIFHQTTDDGIRIVRILHQRMDVARHLRASG